VSALAWIGVGVLGGCASVARHMLGRAVTAARGGAFPLGTLAVNVLGAFVLGLLVALGVHGTALILTGTAALGAFTTFSTWMLETDRLARYDRRALAAINLTLSLLAGVGAVALGRLLG
jgi:fluoride exporter